MKVFVEGFEHRPGEHCASTAIRNILNFHELPLSEAMVFGLAGGLGFFAINNDALSPTRLFHGRTVSLETDFCANTGLPVEGGVEEDDARAWQSLKAQLDAGVPVMLSTDTFYLGYQGTTSHFPGHRAVAVGYDEAEDRVYIADRKLGEYQSVSREELRRSRNADDYPMPCHNEYQHFRPGRLEWGRPLPEIIRLAFARNAQWMLDPPEGPMPSAACGLPGMRSLASELGDWKALDDWSWAARFGYQIIVKRGAGGLFFRSIYRDFLAEAEQAVPALAELRLAEATDAIAQGWGEVAALLKTQSERETCRPELFAQAGARVDDLANREEALFRQLARVAESDAPWESAAA
jgi:hypothetical protein